MATKRRRIRKTKSKRRKSKRRKSKRRKSKRRKSKRRKSKRRKSKRRKSCKYGKLKRRVKTRSGRKRRCKKSRKIKKRKKRKYKIGEEYSGYDSTWDRREPRSPTLEYDSPTFNTPIESDDYTRLTSQLPEHIVNPLNERMSRLQITPRQAQRPPGQHWLFQPLPPSRYESQVDRVMDTVQCYNFIQNDDTSLGEYLDDIGDYPDKTNNIFVYINGRFFCVNLDDKPQFVPCIQSPPSDWMGKHWYYNNRIEYFGVDPIRFIKIDLGGSGFSRYVVISPDWPNVLTTDFITNKFSTRFFKLVNTNNRVNKFIETPYLHPDVNVRNETSDLGAEHCNQNDNIEKPLYKLIPIIDPSTLI